MKKVITISLIAIIFVSLIIPVKAFDPLPSNEQVEYNFKMYYSFKTNGGKAENVVCTALNNCPGSEFGNEYYLLRFTSADAIKESYYNFFGYNSEFYESSEITNLLFPSGIVVFIGNPYDEENKDKFLSLSEIAQSNPDAIVCISEQIGTEYVGKRKKIDSTDPYSIEPTKNNPSETTTDNSTVPATTESTEPITDKATEPATTESTEPITDKPAEPVTTEPTEPTTDKPTESVTTEPQPTVTDPTTPTDKPAVKKKANTVKVTVKNKAVKAKKLKSKKQSVKLLTITNAQGKVTVTLVKSGTTKRIRTKVTVSKKGVITFKKGKYKKDTYKVKLKIIVKGNSNFNPKTLIKTVTVKVK